MPKVFIRDLDFDILMIESRLLRLFLEVLLTRVLHRRQGGQLLLFAIFTDFC